MATTDASILDRVARSLPRSLAERLALARRDVRMVLDGIAGRVPAPVVRQHRVRRSAGLTLGARPVRVREVLRETADAVTLVLEDPTGAPITWAPGQFFTLCLSFDGVALRRAYSASCPPGDGALRVTVKRVAGGVASTHLTTALAVGDGLEVLGPSGAFVVPEVPAPSHVVLVGGGSGITPLFAIARSLLADPDGPRVSLLYGNRAREDVIFADALDALAAAHPQRLTVFHALERGAADWSGRLDETAVHAALGALPDLDAAHYFLCGPAPMRAAARRALEARGVDARRVREEVFAAPHAPAQHSAGDELVTLRVRGAERAVTVRAGETILDAATRAGVAMPYSCAVGGCGACQCRRVAGEVVMEEPNCLRDDERAAGQVLTCVGRPGGAGVVLEVP